MHSVYQNMYQSPYKGFNSKNTAERKVSHLYQSPYKGFNSGVPSYKIIDQRSQSPYKGFNRPMMMIGLWWFV